MARIREELEVELSEVYSFAKNDDNIIVKNINNVISESIIIQPKNDIEKEIKPYWNAAYELDKEQIDKETFILYRRNWSELTGYGRKRNSQVKSFYTNLKGFLIKDATVSPCHRELVVLLQYKHLETTNDLYSIESDQPLLYFLLPFSINALQGFCLIAIASSNTISRQHDNGSSSTRTAFIPFYVFVAIFSSLTLAQSFSSTFVQEFTYYHRLWQSGEISNYYLSIILSIFIYLLRLPLFLLCGSQSSVKLNGYRNPKRFTMFSLSRSTPAPSRSAPAPTRQAPPPAPPAHAPTTMAPAPQQGGGMLSGLGATMAQGFAFGTGSAIAREAVGAVMGSFSGGKQEAPVAQAPPTQSQYNTAPPATAVCGDDHKAFMQCLTQNPGNASNCDQYFNALQACQSRN
eukprot:gene8459-11439_t